MSTRAQIRRLIVMHLAATALVGCKTAPDTTSTTQPTTQATTNVPAGTKPLGDECTKDNECATGFCAIPFDGAEFHPPGQCVAEAPMYEGRPLSVAGVDHVAQTKAGDWRLGPRLAPELPAMSSAKKSFWAAQLERSAVEEHASIAAFARTLCELVAVGAPGWLLAETQAALSDEIRHTDACLALYCALTGRDITPDALPAAVAPFSDLDAVPVRLLADVFRGGCVGETRAAHRALERASVAPASALKSHFEMIAGDESRHAALAFKTLRWLVDQHPELGADLAALSREYSLSAGADDRAMIEPLLQLAMTTTV
jgi:hypothetical protein